MCGNLVGTSKLGSQVQAIGVVPSGFMEHSYGALLFYRFSAAVLGNPKQVSLFLTRAMGKNHEHDPEEAVGSIST